MTSRGYFCRSGAGWRTVACFALICVAFSAYAGTASAADEQETSISDQVDAWKDDVKTHVKAADDKALSADLERAADLYEAAAGDEKLRKDLIKQVGLLAKGTGDETRIVAVLEMLGTLGHADGARYVRPYLRQRDDRDAGPVLRAAIAAAGKAPASSLVKPLLKLVTDSKHMGIVQEAVTSLGGFAGLKRQRAKILEELVDAAQRVKPGGRPRMRGGTDPMDGGYGDGGSAPVGQDGGPTARWQALSRSVPAALRRMTGIEESTIQGWFILVKDNKGKLARLFRDDE